MQFIAAFVFVLHFCHSNGETNETQPIQTFVIPHSHMDVGWVYTIEVGSCHLAQLFCCFCFAFFLKYSRKSRLIISSSRCVIQ